MPLREQVEAKTKYIYTDRQLADIIILGYAFTKLLYNVTSPVTGCLEWVAGLKDEDLVNGICAKGDKKSVQGWRFKSTDKISIDNLLKTIQNKPPHVDKFCLAKKKYTDQDLATNPTSKDKTDIFLLQADKNNVDKIDIYIEYLFYECETICMDKELFKETYIKLK